MDVGQVLHLPAGASMMVMMMIMMMFMFIIVNCHHFDHPNILFLVGGPRLTRPNHCGKDSGQHVTFKEKDGTYIYDGGFGIRCSTDILGQQ